MTQRLHLWSSLCASCFENQNQLLETHYQLLKNEKFQDFTVYFSKPLHILILGPRTPTVDSVQKREESVLVKGGK